MKISPKLTRFHENAGFHDLAFSREKKKKEKNH